MSLQEIIRDRRLVLQEIGDAIGVNKGTVSRWQTGKAELPIRYLRPLARLLGVTLDELVPPEALASCDRPAPRSGAA